MRPWFRAGARLRAQRGGSCRCERVRRARHVRMVRAQWTAAHPQAATPDRVMYANTGGV